MQGTKGDRDISLAAIIKIPEAAKKQLTSSVQANREPPKRGCPRGTLALAFSSGVSLIQISSR